MCVCATWCFRIPCQWVDYQKLLKRGRLRARKEEPINSRGNILLVIYTNIVSAEACSQIGSSVTPARETARAVSHSHMGRVHRCTCSVGPFVRILSSKLITRARHEHASHLPRMHIQPSS